MPLNINLNRQSEVPLSRQLYDALRDLILSGRLEPGERIPSTRELAEELQISRPTISESLAQLIAEGYVETKHGSGTFVSMELNALRKPHQRPEPRWSHYARVVAALPPVPYRDRDFDISFFCWRPALDIFPTAEWARILGRQARAADISMLDVGDPAGEPALRKSIASVCAAYRDVRCSPDQVILTSGLNQALDLVAKLHLEPDSQIALEDPGYPGARSICQAYGAKPLPLPVDRDGLILDALFKAADAKVDMVYCTPARQFPTGHVMTLSRRLQLIDWAKRTGCLILEDDYDSIYHVHGRPIPALMSLEPDSCVVYAGTLNQELFPALGLGYLVVPERFVELYRRAKRLSGEQIPRQVQLSVSDFIDEGHLDRHVRRLGALYGARRSALLAALHEHFKDKVVIVSGDDTDSAGVFIICRFKTDLASEQITAAAADRGVGLMSTQAFYSGPAPRNEFILGFGSLDEKAIQEGVRRLRGILR